MSGRQGLVCRIAASQIGVLLCVSSLCSAAAASQAPRVTNGGFMQAQLGDKAVPLPLKHTAVDAEVAGTVAAVKVTQQFHNPFRRPIEAVYVFPLPHRAAVHAMTIKVGARVIQGKVLRRARAREVYEQARKQGKTAALLDQERPNIFTQSVANILPGDQIEVQLRYVEDLTPEDGRYEFVFPMVVGPRYVGGNDPLPRQDRGEGWSADTARVPDASRITPRLLAKGLRPGHDISVRLRLVAGVPIQHLRAITHRVKLEQQGNQAVVQLDPRDAIPNKDFVVRYQLTGAQPDVAVLAQRDRRGGHFLLMIQPKARMARRDVAPREHVFVVDNSGSMYGFPLQQAQRVVRRCLKSLRPRDTFQIIKFAGAPDQFAERAVPATAANVRAGIGYVRRMRGGGGTEFLPALERALRARKDPARARIVLFITDGYIGYEADVLRYLRDYGAKSSTFALGVGSSVNRFLIDGMARMGHGVPFYLLNSEKAASVAERVFSTISRPALTSIAVDWNGLDVAEVAPATIPDLFGERPVVVAGRYRKGGRATITVRGQLAGKPFAKQVRVELPDKPSANNAAVAYLWARRQIADGMDRLATANSEQGRKRAEKRVTALALRYNLVSRFTSMVAVDTQVRNPGGKQQRTDVPLPLPAGVSSRAAPGHAYARSAGVLGVLRGKGSGAAYGVGGLGMVGKGRGGGGTGQGTIGLGSLGTIGRGGGGGSGVGYGRGAGRLGGRRVAVPAIRVGRAMVTGSLDKNIIRRVIRRHINEVRYCYQKALQRNPKLSGRIVVEFTLAADGRVVAARIKQTTIKAPQLEADLLRAVRRWRFPAVPGGGVVVVSYPFVLKPPR